MALVSTELLHCDRRCYKDTMKAKTVLVVDDEPDIVELVSYNLTKEGFQVSSAPDGEEALNKLRKGAFDLLILDLGTQSPHMHINGPRLYK